MKHEAEQELLKTINRQSSELPAVVKAMVQQYQTSAIVLSILCGVLFIAALIGTIWLAHYFFKKGENQSPHDKICGTDYTVGCIATSFVGGFLSVIMFSCSVINVIHACAPIISIIQSLLN